LKALAGEEPSTKALSNSGSNHLLRAQAWELRDPWGSGRFSATTRNDPGDVFMRRGYTHRDRPTATEASRARALARRNQGSGRAARGGVLDSVGDSR